MRLTIIIPTLNNETTIRQLLVSIDSKEHYRILCIDGGSTDQTIPLIEKLQKELKHISLIQLQNASKASCINKGLMEIEITEGHHSDAFIILNPTSILLPNKLDLLTSTFKNNENIDIVIGQRAVDYHGEWKLNDIDSYIKNNHIVTLPQQPELLESLTFDNKLLSVKFADLRCDETFENAYNHEMIVKALQKATDIQLVSQLVVGDNQENEANFNNVIELHQYTKEIMSVRQRVMEMLLLLEQRLIYSDMVDQQLFNTHLKRYLLLHPEMTETIISLVSDYIMSMQHSDYLSQNMFEIINTVEFLGVNWNKETYEKWRQMLIQVGINRPSYRKFLIQLKGRKIVHQTKSILKRQN
ncbi:glycosyltransferase family 2 protein [Staphylococcus sp. SS21]|nr:glycosyltransferase family 2 protein [Staphylococcus singaporensis]